MAEEKKGGFKAFCQNCWQKTKSFFKTCWQKVKSIKWAETVKPVIGFSIFGGVVALAVLIGVLVICL